MTFALQCTQNFEFNTTKFHCEFVIIATLHYLQSYSPLVVTLVSYIEILLSKFIFSDPVVMCLRQIVNILGVSYFTAVNLRSCNHKIMHWLVNNAEMNRALCNSPTSHTARPTDLRVCYSTQITMYSTRSIEVLKTKR